MKTSLDKISTGRLLTFLSLFTSTGTLLCCALPAFLVALGFGAAFAGLTSAIPQLIWLGENKNWIFAIGGVLLMVGGYLQLRARKLSCPTDPEQAAVCSTARDWSIWVYVFSLILYCVGGAVAYGYPLLGNL